MKDFEYKNITIGLNYATTETDNEDVIYLQTEGKYAGDGNIIAITVEEEEIIANNLMVFVKLFKKTK
jgi:uncharacterized beta-barrel protein YwiB (DUF1934 family)